MCSPDLRWTIGRMTLKCIYQTPATRKIGTRLDAYINKINKILAVFFRLKYIILKTKSSNFSCLKYMRVVPIHCVVLQLAACVTPQKF